MEAKRLDRIHIRDLLLRCIIGVRAWEREGRQNVLLNITLHADLAAACRTDDFAETVDYVSIKKRAIELVEGSSFQLVEALAEAVARSCLEDPRVQRVDVTLEKPGALRFARTVAVEITRERE
jgi:FolB domain-containing protein